MNYYPEIGGGYVYWNGHFCMVMAKNFAWYQINVSFQSTVAALCGAIYLLLVICIAYQRRGSTVESRSAVRIEVQLTMQFFLVWIFFVYVRYA